MIDLDRGTRAVFLNHSSQALEAGDKFIFMCPDVADVAGVLINRGIAHRDDAYASPGPFGVKIDQLIADLKVYRHVHVHGRHANSVF